MDDNGRKDPWDKAHAVAAVAAVIASILVPLTALIVGNWVTSGQKESENRIKYLQLAVSVLRSEPTESTIALRQWAIDVLAAQSPVPLSADVRNELKGQKVNLNVGYGTSYGYGGYTVSDFDPRTPVAPWPSASSKK